MSKINKLNLKHKVRDVVWVVRDEYPVIEAIKMVIYSIEINVGISSIRIVYTLGNKGDILFTKKSDKNVFTLKRNAISHARRERKAMDFLNS